MIDRDDAAPRGTARNAAFHFNALDFNNDVYTVDQRKRTAGERTAEDLTAHGDGIPVIQRDIPAPSRMFNTVEAAGGVG